MNRINELKLDLRKKNEDDERKKQKKIEKINEEFEISKYEIDSSFNKKLKLYETQL